VTSKKSLVVGAAALVCSVVTEAGAGPCYVDSEGGDDANDGLSEASPVRTQDAIPASCTEVYYARGSVFREPVATGGGFGGPGGGGGARTLFTNYGDPNLPLPAFIVESGSVVSSFQGAITVDGLHLEGSRGDGTMENLIQGVCVTMGGDSQLLNCEITDCDIGIMLMGENSLVQGNVIHDLNMAVDSTDTSIYANIVGGAEGIFVNGSNNEVAYNTFFNCKDTAQWVGGNCDGGATEVSVPRDGEVANVRIHHNFSYNNCGFFEVSGFGTFRDSDFYYNISIDSSWIGLLQVNETALSNVSWVNNTIVHHPESQTPAIFMIYGEDQGAGQLEPGTVNFENNLVILAGANSFLATVDERINQSNNLITSSDPGVVNIDGVSATDFELVAGSAAIDGGATTPYTRDFLNRIVPAGSAPDIGAMEYGAEPGEPLPEQPEVTTRSETDSGSGSSDIGTGTATASAETGFDTDTGTGTGPGTSTAVDDPTGTGTGTSAVTDTGTGTGTGTGTDTGVVIFTCTAPLVACDGACVDVTVDAAHCGACRAACADGQVCSGGRCQTTCAAGQTLCEQSCVDLTTNLLHCGACGAACLVGQQCSAGACVGAATGGDLTTGVTSVATGTGTGHDAAGGADDSADDSACACAAVGSPAGAAAPWSALLGLLGALSLRRRRR